MRSIVKRIAALEEKAGMQEVPSVTIVVAFVGADGKTESSFTLTPDGQQIWKEQNNEGN